MRAPTRFTSALDVRFPAPGDPSLGERATNRMYAILLQPLVWEIDYSGSPIPHTADLDPQRFVVIPQGFVSDGITSPRWLWWFVPPWGSNASRAATLHDYLLDALVKHRNPHPRFTTRRSVDAVFYEALLAIGVARFPATLMWWAVRCNSARRAAEQWILTQWTRSTGDTQ